MMKKVLFCVIVIYFFSVIFILSENSYAIDAYQNIGLNNYYHETARSYYVNIGPSNNTYKNYEYKDNEKLSLDIGFFEFDIIIAEAAKKHGIDFLLIKAIIQVESNFNPMAISDKGAKGLMQIMPDNYELLNINNPFNPVENIMGGTKYLRLQIDKFDDQDLALAAYNAGPDQVVQNRGIPNITETIEYVKKIKKLYNTFTLSEKLSIETKTVKGGEK